MRVAPTAVVYLNTPLTPHNRRLAQRPQPNKSRIEKGKLCLYSHVFSSLLGIEVRSTESDTCGAIRGRDFLAIVLDRQIVWFINSLSRYENNFPHCEKLLRFFLQHWRGWRLQHPQPGDAASYRELADQLLLKAATDLPNEVAAALKRAQQREPVGTAKAHSDTILKNVDVSRAKGGDLVRIPEHFV